MNKLLYSLTIALFFLASGVLNARGQEDSSPLDSYEPNYESVVFVPKGQWITGVSVSYSQSNQKNYQFLILENINGDTYSFKVTPMLAFAFKNDMAAGAKFAYSRNLTKLASTDISLGDDMNFGVDHLYRLAHNYSGMAIFRSYFSLGTSQRFGFFAELQAQVGGGQSKLMDGIGGNIIGSYETNLSCNVGVAPGMVAFLNDYSAIEVNVGVLGFNYSHTKQINNQIYISNRHSQSANFKLNLFSITFGVAFYL